MGKSKAQDALTEELAQIYPTSYIDDEVYIGNLVEERGYSLQEIQRELGNKPHKMFVDIVLRDSDRTVAFEYHGEQHYSLVGNMTKTTADLLVNQKLDREKSWILQRIGIPLVAIPYDMYIDESVIEHLIDEASEEADQAAASLSECPVCQRRFPLSQMPDGACKKCVDASREEAIETRKEEAAAKRRQSAKERAKKLKERAKKNKGAQETTWKRYASNNQETDDEYKEAQKERARQYRKKKYEEWKASPEYAAQKEEAKRLRREAYQKAKAERKRRGGK